jgi:hypothetical protein
MWVDDIHIDATESEYQVLRHLEGAREVMVVCELGLTIRNNSDDDMLVSGLGLWLTLVRDFRFTAPDGTAWYLAPAYRTAVGAEHAYTIPCVAGGERSFRFRAELMALSKSDGRGQRTPVDAIPSRLTFNVAHDGEIDVRRIRDNTLIAPDTATVGGRGECVVTLNGCP